MPVVIEGEKYYRTAEACRIAGISKNTFLRWAREGVLPDVQRRDRRGWRLFTTSDLHRLKTEANQIVGSSEMKTQ
ncbi:MAG TPA: helix-turn-helix domain-containing protein [Dehalococcoidia bacterium]|nr:helix-turn-helix domain-containing protein [Dehalococcoidia bacterium]